MKVEKLLEREAQFLNDTELKALSVRFVRFYARLLHEATGVEKFEGLTNGEILEALLQKDVIEVAPGTYSMIVDPATDPIAIRYRRAVAH